MELPALKLPDVPLPFDIPTLMHPPIVHFVVAIPILVIVIEIVNLILKKRAIGVLTFAMLILGMVATAVAYKTGTIDGKEAFDALTQAGQEELKEHKLLGTYLVIGSAIILVFKMLSALLKKGLIKALYLLVLIVFIAGILKQGKDGGELVYEYGANVERVQALEDELYDAQEEADAATEKKSEAAPKHEATAPKAEAKHEAPAAKEEPKHEAPAPAHEETPSAPVAHAVEEAKKTVEHEAHKAVETTKEVAQTAVDTVKEEAHTVATDAVNEATSQAHDTVVAPVEHKVEEVTHAVEEATQHPAVPAVETPEALPHH